MPEALFMVFLLDSKGAKESKGAKVMNYFHVYVINFPSFYSVFSVLYIFNISFSTSVLFSKRRISVNRFRFFFPKRRISVHLVDLVRSFQTSIYYLLAKFGFDTAENGPLKVSQKLAKS